LARTRDKAAPDISPGLYVLEETFAVCRLNPEDEIPGWATVAGFCSVTRTRDELSVVCPVEYVPEGVKFEAEWRAFELEGPLEFSLVGVLAGISTSLAEAGVSIFAISTYDTDYVLVKEEKLVPAIAALRRRGYEVS